MGILEDKKSSTPSVKPSSEPIYVFLEIKQRNTHCPVYWLNQVKLRTQRKDINYCTKS